MEPFTCIHLFTTEESHRSMLVHVKAETQKQANIQSWNAVLGIVAQEGLEKTVEHERTFVFLGTHEALDPDIDELPTLKVEPISDDVVAMYNTLIGEPGFENQVVWALVQGFYGREQTNYIAALADVEGSSERQFVPMYVELTESMMEMVGSPADYTLDESDYSRDQATQEALDRLSDEAQDEAVGGDEIINHTKH